MGTIIVPTKTDTTKTTCIEITSESYKCIDISAFVPTCITITSNVPTSDLYQEQYDRDPVETTEAPQLQIALINNEAPILNVNMDADGMYYVTDFDTVYIDITNWNANAEYVNVFSNQDGNEAVIFLDEVEQRIIWALDDWAWDDTQMWLYAQAKESDKLISPQGSVTVTTMEQTDQPNLSSWVSQTEQTVLNITILDYDATYTYADPIVTGGTAVRTDNIIAWTLPDVTADTYHEISITATAPLMYESLAGVSGGSVLLQACWYETVTESLTVGYATVNVTMTLLTSAPITCTKSASISDTGYAVFDFYFNGGSETSGSAGAVFHGANDPSTCYAAGSQIRATHRWRDFCPVYKTVSSPWPTVPNAYGTTLSMICSLENETWSASLS